MSPAPPSRLVVLAPNWLGDVVMALPALASVRGHWPEAHLAVAARRSIAPLLRLIDGVNEVVALEGRGGWRDLVSAGADARRLAEGAFDAALILPNSFHAALLVRRAGIAERWGFRADLRAGLLTRGVAKPRAAMHQAEYYLALVTAIGAPPAPLVAAIRPDVQGARRASELLAEGGWRAGSIVAFAPGAAYGMAKRWPPDRVGAVAARLAREAGVTPVLVGAAADEATAAQVALAYATHSAEARFIDLTGRTDLPALVGVLARAAVVVSNDSGAMHIAAAVGVPVAAIFGPTDERRTSPLPHPSMTPTAIIGGAAWCRPCQLRTCPIDHRCMTSIGVDRVVTEVRRLLGRGATAPGEAA